MKTITFILPIFIVIMLPFVSCTEDYLTINDTDNEEELPSPYQEIKGWFDYLCSPQLGGRYSGSEGIDKAVEYIVDIVGESDSLTVDLFKTSKCLMRNIIFHINGVSDSLVVLGAHYDAYGYSNNTALPGADDNMSGCAVLLSVIKSIQRTGIQPQYSIDICLFDGEEIGRFGSNHYLSNCEKGIKLYINVDTCGKKDDGLIILYDGNHPYLQVFFERLRYLIRDVTLRASVYNPQGYTTDCEPFKRKGVPYVSIQNSTHSDYLHSSRDDVSHISFMKISQLADGIGQYLRSYY